MKLDRPVCAHVDDRGSILDVLDNVPIDSVTIVTMKEGSVRGNHYHKQTLQWVYLLEGKLKLLTQIPGEAVKVTVLEKGDLALTAVLEHHAVHALTDSTLLVLTRGPRRGSEYEKDTFRLPVPLSECVAENAQA